MTHSLFSQNQDMPVKWYEKFDRQAIKQDIISLLAADPTDVIEYCKEYPDNDPNKWMGNEIIDFYQVNPKTGHPSKVILKGDKVYYKPLIEMPLPI